MACAFSSGDRQAEYKGVGTALIVDLLTTNTFLARGRLDVLSIMLS